MGEGQLTGANNHAAKAPLNLLLLLCNIVPKGANYSLPTQVLTQVSPRCFQ
jgi:hypothetical protein